MLRTPYRSSHGKITLVLYNAPFWCGGKCIYCFVAKGFTRSTSQNEDTILAKECNWEPRCQLEERLKRYGLTRGLRYKYDLAMKGDTFTHHPKHYLTEFVKSTYDFFNQCESTTLEDAIMLQSSAPDRCVTFKVETRPDHVDENWCQFLLDLGVTTVEIGVQSLDENVLEFNRRGHGIDAVIQATGLLKRYGFEVLYQLMVGMPGATRESDYSMLAEKLWEEPFCPDALKIYPCILLKQEVARHIKLTKLLGTPHWHPISTNGYIKMLKKAYQSIPRYVHINRIQRIFEPSKIAVGPADIIDRSMFNNLSKCLWQRSVAQKSRSLNENFSDYRVECYKQGHGYCFEAIVDEDTVIGYGRLNLLDKNRAIVRDVRTVGNMLPVAEKNTHGIGTQHIGVGTEILRVMERLALKEGVNEILVHPAPGVQTFFEKRGYFPGPKRYLLKDISAPYSFSNNVKRESASIFLSPVN